MTEILFYHLVSQKMVMALPPILEKCLERDWKVVIQSPMRERLESLDNDLWTYRDDSFLPHGLSGNENAADQVILLTDSDENENNASILVLLDDARRQNLNQYERVVYMFDGHDEEMVEKARQFWIEVKQDDSFKPTYWQQTPEGHWQQKET